MMFEVPFKEKGAMGDTHIQIYISNSQDDPHAEEQTYTVTSRRDVYAKTHIRPHRNTQGHILAHKQTWTLR